MSPPWAHPSAAPSVATASADEFVKNRRRVTMESSPATPLAAPKHAGGRSVLVARIVASEPPREGMDVPPQSSLTAARYSPSSRYQCEQAGRALRSAQCQLRN